MPWCGLIVHTRACILVPLRSGIMDLNVTGLSPPPHPSLSPPVHDKKKRKAKNDRIENDYSSIMIIVEMKKKRKKRRKSQIYTEDVIINDQTVCIIMNYFVGNDRPMGPGVCGRVQPIMEKPPMALWFCSNELQPYERV